MKKTIILLFLLLGIKCFSQKIDKEFITGFWKVENIEKAPSHKIFDDLKLGFKSTVFHFNKNGSFKMISSYKLGFFGEMTNDANKTNWKLDGANGVEIGTKENHFTFMEIKVRIINDEVLFDLGNDEVELILKVRKEK